MASSQRGDSLRSAFPLSPPLVSFILFPFIRSAPQIVVSFKTLMSPDLPPLSALLAPSPASNPNKGAKTGSLTKLKNQVLRCSAAYCASEKARSSCQIFMQALFLFYFKFSFDQKRGWGREEKKKKEGNQLGSHNTLFRAPCFFFLLAGRRCERQGQRCSRRTCRRRWQARGWRC